ncbi:MAG: outer membrane protein assembly factor BamD, partial [Pseudomonadota bacterium]
MMDDLWSRPSRSLGVMALAATLAACGGSSGTNLENTAPEAIYQQAEGQLAQGDADRAAVLFSEVERLYPYSEFAKRGLIMQAFAYHQDQDYENARLAAQRYIDFYPA